MAPPRESRAESEHPDLVIARFAAQQHGVVSRAQLLAAGVGYEAIRHRVGVKRLRTVHAGVYSVGHRPSLNGHLLAAVIAAGASAVLSHSWAAALWDLRHVPSGPIDVTIPRGQSRRVHGIVVHATRSLPPDEVTVHNGIACTTVARTLVDLAAVESVRRLHRALEQALILRVFDGAALNAALDRANGRRGVGTLRRLLAGLDDEASPTRTELERRFVELVADAGLPAPVVNARLAGHEVDFHWPAQRLVVETDGRETHDTVVAFERDHQRDLDLELAGWHVLRVTWRQVVGEPQRVAALIAARLGR